MENFIKQGDDILVNVPYAEAYIPYSNFSDPDKGHPAAYEYGEGVRAIGLFNMRLYRSDEDDQNSAKLRTFNYPNMITMYPTDREVKVLQLSPDMEPDKYWVLKFYQGDRIMNSKMQKNSKFCESFMNFLIKGKLPKGLSYQDLYIAWEKNFQINGVNPGVPAITLQTIISENCRSKDNPMIQFRKAINEPGVGMSDYKVYNMVDICSHSSVMNSLIFERFGEMLTSSLTMSKTNAKQNVSPLEQVLTM